MNWLLWLAILLVVLWVAAQIFGWVVGAVINILWIVALVLLAVWLFQRVRTNV